VQADERGRFDAHGGRFVPETLVPALTELEQAFAQAWADDRFHEELDGLLARYAGRPTPLFEAVRVGHEHGGARVLLKREDLCHTGAHKINNALGQVLLATRMGKRRVIAETGAGQHGVATATACALFGLPCEIYMGRVDVERQAPNVQRMELLGARVRPVDAGASTLKDALNEALRDWVASVGDTHYVLGSAAGPHPFPTIVKQLQSVIGREARAQCLSLAGRLPDAAVACVGGGSNAIGLFSAFEHDPAVALVAVEAAGLGLDSGRHGASLARGRPGVLHGAMSYVLQDRHGQISEAHSISAGLDYPGVGPELSALRDRGRLRLDSATDAEAIAALRYMARATGILPALESAHAIAASLRICRELGPAGLLLVNVSGRGDKDLEHIRRLEAASPAGSAGPAMTGSGASS
jgi:tryptophan synthase beta chain